MLCTNFAQRNAQIGCARYCASAPLDDIGTSWNRAAAVITRQAIVLTLNRFWSVHAPDMRWANWREKWTAMPAYFDYDSQVVPIIARAHYSWEALSEGCHHRGYDLGLTEPELRAHLAVAQGFARAVGARGRRTSG